MSGKLALSREQAEWASSRIKEGWTYSKVGDVLYVDGQTVMRTLKIMGLYERQRRRANDG